MSVTPADSDWILLPDSGEDRVIDFASICKIDEANPTTNYDGIATISNAGSIASPGTSFGPAVGTEERLLLRVDGVARWIAGSRAIPHIRMIQDVSWAIRANAVVQGTFQWNFNIITAAFDTSTVTWNTKPATTPWKTIIVTIQDQTSGGDPETLRWQETTGGAEGSVADYTGIAYGVEVAIEEWTVGVVTLGGNLNTGASGTEAVLAASAIWLTPA